MSYRFTLTGKKVADHVFKKSIPDRCPDLGALSIRSQERYILENEPFAEIVREGSELFLKLKPKLNSDRDLYFKADPYYVYGMKKGCVVSIYRRDSIEGNSSVKMKDLFSKLELATLKKFGENLPLTA